MENEYRFERLSEANLGDLIYLIKDIYDRDHSIVDLKRKYDTNIWGAQYIGYIAYSHENQPAGYYGVLPVLIEYNGRKILAAQSGDTMTHSQHRRKGLFTKLALHTYELAKKEGIEFVFGFPVEASFPGFQKKLNWAFKEQIQSHNLLIYTFPFSELLRKKASSKLAKHYDKLVHKRLKSNQSEIKSISNSVLKRDVAGLIRDAHYFKYKDDGCKYFIQEGGTTAWIKYDGALTIGDITQDSPSEKEFNKLLRKLKRIAFFSGINRIRAYCSPDTSLDKLFKGRSKAKTGLHVGYLDFTSNIPIEHLKFTYADFDTF